MKLDASLEAVSPMSSLGLTKIRTGVAEGQGSLEFLVRVV